MDDALRHQRDASLYNLEALVRRGRQITAARGVDDARLWQRDCAAAVNELSGGSKAHWLSRAFSNAFLVRASDGGVIVEADALDIADRIVAVLEQAMMSLAQLGDEPAPSSVAAPRPRRFDFVHEEGVRPVLEQVFDDSRSAFERGDFPLALILSCSAIETLLTDAIGYARGDSGTRTGETSFEARIAEAETAGLIRGGCARLPPVARRYRDLTDASGELRVDVAVSEREARVARQVLHVVMRDLDPGR